MKIRRLSIIFFVALTIVFFYGCSCNNDANNQNTQNKTEETHFSMSETADENTKPSEKEDGTAKSDEETSEDNITAITSEPVTNTESPKDYEPAESTTPTDKTPQGEPEINFSDLL